MPEGEEIKVKYIESNIEISKIIINENKDRIILQDGTDISNLSESIIKKPSSLDSKILSLIDSVSENIGIKSDELSKSLTDTLTNTLSSTSEDIDDTLGIVIKVKKTED